MSKELPAPIPRLTVITLGVSDIRASIAFYDALGFSRRLKVTGEAAAFYDTGGPVLALFPLESARGRRHIARYSEAIDVPRHDARMELSRA
ncbi:catechol 2,3-dioxygenase-like lactoylglutathione lyase family enzyme [Bradyrhizobium sp. LM3.4]